MFLLPGCFPGHRFRRPLCARRALTAEQQQRLQDILTGTRMPPATAAAAAAAAVQRYGSWGRCVLANYAASLFFGAHAFNQLHALLLSRAAELLSISAPLARTQYRT